MGWSRINLAISMIDERAADAEIFDMLDQAARLGQSLDTPPRHCRCSQGTRNPPRTHRGTAARRAAGTQRRKPRVVAHGDSWMLFDCVAGRSYVHLRDGDPQRARNSLTEELALCTDVIDDHINLCAALVEVSWYLTYTGNLARSIEIVELVAGRPDELTWPATSEWCHPPSKRSSPNSRLGRTECRERPLSRRKLALGDLGRTGVMSPSNEGSE